MGHTKLVLKIDGQWAGDFIILQQVNDVEVGLLNAGWTSVPPRSDEDDTDGVFTLMDARATITEVK